MNREALTIPNPWTLNDSTHSPSWWQPQILSCSPRPHKGQSHTPIEIFQLRLIMTDYLGPGTLSLQTKSVFCLQNRRRMDIGWVTNGVTQMPSLILIKQMKFCTIVMYHFSLIILANVKHFDNIQCWQHCRRPAFHFTFGRSEQWYKFSRTLCQHLSKF